MDKKDKARKQFNERLSGVKRGLYTDKSIYDIAKEQSRLEREADKLLKSSKGVTKNGRSSKNASVL
jgi:hypothetical protein